MKRFLILFLFLNYFFCKAQVYHPFPTDSAEWRIDMQTPIQFGTGHFPVLYYMRGDTILSSMSYHKIFLSNDSIPGMGFSQYYLREQNKIIYFRNNNDTLERTLYDYNLNLNDTIWLCNSNCMLDSFTVTSKDSVLTFAGYRNRITLNSLSGQGGVYQMQWVEGIGDIINGLMYLDVPWVDWWFQLLCFHDHGSMIWNYQNSSCWITGVNENSSQNIYYNYFPNPFSDYFIIRYKLQKAGTVSVIITDVSGRILKTILSEKQNVDEHEIYFDSSELPSGVYFYKMETEYGIRSGKMIKLK